MMKKILSSWMWFCCLLVLCASCQEKLEAEPPVEEGMTLRFSVHSQDTIANSRTVLQGKDPIQHVTYVQLYLFEGTDSEALCVASENVSWQHWEGANEGLPSREQVYKLVYKGMKDGIDYMFLAVGLDATHTDSGVDEENMNNSAATYGLPESIVVGTTTLGEANATLASGKDRKDIAGSELFAGYKVLTKRDLSRTQRIDLYRRVAGVMCYLTNVPANVNGHAVSKLQVKLYQGQNTQVPLRKLEGGSVFIDYITSPMETDDGNVLVDIDYASEGVLKKGSYVLPALGASGLETTMVLAFIGEDGSELLRKKIYCVNTYEPVYLSRGETDEGTGIIGGSEDEEVELDETAYHYPIVANNFYSIGTEENPIDLSNNSYIIVSVNPNWDMNHNMNVGKGQS